MQLIVEVKCAEYSSNICVCVCVNVNVGVVYENCEFHDNIVVSIVSFNTSKCVFVTIL